MKKLAYLVTVVLTALWAVDLGWADEARPVYVEVVQTQSDPQTQGDHAKHADFVLKWKIPPVMAAASEPSITMHHPACIPTFGETATGLLGRRHYRCDLELLQGEVLSVNIDYPQTNPGLNSLVVFKPQTGDAIQIFSDPVKTLIPIPMTASATAVAYQYTVVGIEHILIGTDHLLFVLCLMIIAGGYRRLLITVTGFTLAHSITLGLAILEIVRLPTPLVEWLIALSIVLLAVEIVKHNRNPQQRTQSFTWRYPVAAASLLGLLHGFGFAVVLQELGLPTAMKLNALLFFNLGVELGQILFIVMVSLLIAAARLVITRTPNRTVGVEIAGYAIGICGSYWLLERSQFLFQVS